MIRFEIHRRALSLAQHETMGTDDKRCSGPVKAYGRKGRNLGIYRKESNLPYGERDLGRPVWDPDDETSIVGLVSQAISMRFPRWARELSKGCGVPFPWAKVGVDWLPNECKGYGQSSLPRP